MVQVELEPEIEQELRRVAGEEHMTEANLMRDVMTRWLEDRADYARGMQVLRDMKYSVSQEEMNALSDAAN